MIQLYADRIDGTIAELDVDQNAVVLLKKSFADLKDIDKRIGDYTQTFSLPKTQQNLNFFGNFGDPSEIGYNWSSRLLTACYLVEDSGVIITGSLKYEDSDPKVNSINVSVVGAISKIKDVFGDGLMSDLDMNDWAFEPSDIFQTWNQSLFNGDMVFPVHDFGFGYGLYKKEGGALVVQDPRVSTTPIVLNKCIPAFRLTTLMKMLFEQKGFQVQGSWFDEANADDIFVQADNNLSKFIASASLWETVIKNDQLLTTTETVIGFEDDPESSDFDAATHTFTAPVDGFYYFDLVITIDRGNPQGLIMLAQFKKNGVNSGGVIQFPWNTTSTTTNRRISLVKGDTVNVTIRESTGSTKSGYIRAYSNTSLNLVNIEQTDDEIIPSAYWANQSQIEMLRNIIQIFNIVIWSDTPISFRLDTWDYYMANYGEDKDWSEKLDVDSIQTLPINSELRDPINLSLKDSDDILNYQYRESLGRNYGSYWENNKIPFAQDFAPNMPKFSPAPTQHIIMSDTSLDNDEMIVAKYYESEDNIAYKSPGLQLMYYNGVRALSAPNQIYTIDLDGDIAGPQLRTGYPFFSVFKLDSANSYAVEQTTLDLNFTYMTPPSLVITAPSEYGLYNRYFREMLRERYDVANKVMFMDFILNPMEVSNLSAADKIIARVNGTPVKLRVVEVPAYSAGAKRATRLKVMITFG